MAGLDHQAVILNTIDSLRSRKARPDFERICHMVERRYGMAGFEVITELNRLVDAEIVIKVEYKGNTSYRNAAKWCKTRPYGSIVNSDSATRSILAAIEKITVPKTAKQGQDSEDAEHPGKGPNGDQKKSIALEGASLEEIEKYFADENPETKFVRSFLEEALKREVGAKRLYISPDNKYVLAKYAVSGDEKLDEQMKRGPRPSKRKRIKKTHGPDFEQEPLIKTSIWDQRCDYCTLPASCNKFGDKEELLVCKDCAVKVHPSCMKYSRQLAQRSRLSPWQCMHCKTCHVCNDAGDWDTLLFCDSCDKGYHMACHNPIVEEKPQGKWVCELCTSEDMEIGSNITDEDSVISSLSGSIASNLEEKPDATIGNGSSQTSGQSTPDVATPNQSLPANLPLQSAQSQAPSTPSLPSPKTKVAPHPVSWSLDDVVNFLREKGFKDQAETFRDQEIDGHALLLLRRSDVLTGLSFKLGPALKIYQLVSKLQISQAKDSLNNSKRKSSVQTMSTKASPSSSLPSNKGKPSKSSVKSAGLRKSGKGKWKASIPSMKSSPPSPNKPAVRNQKPSPPKSAARAKSVSPKTKAEPDIATTPPISKPPAETPPTDSTMETDNAIPSLTNTETPPKTEAKSPGKSGASPKATSPVVPTDELPSPKTPPS